MLEVHAVFITLLGLCLGSFANVIIYRLPAGKSIVLPRSACLQCKKQLAWYHNIPIISWLFLKGKCAYCKSRISFRYPLVEFIVGLLFLMSYKTIGLQWFLIEFLYFSFALVVVSAIDFDHYILPDVFTLSGILIGLFGAALNPDRLFMDSLLGVLLGGGLLWGVAFFYFLWRKQEGMGGGDIKLLAWIGAVLGWQAIPFVILFASLVGTFVGLSLIVSQKNSLKSTLPFGPYLSLGAVAYVFVGNELGLLYMNLII